MVLTMVMNWGSSCLQYFECVCVLVPLRPLQHWVCVCHISARHCVSRVVPHCVCVCFQEWRDDFYRGRLVFYAHAPHFFWFPPIEEFVYKYLWIWLRASSGVQVVQGKIPYLKGTKKIGAGSFFASLSAKLFGLLSNVCQCVGPWDVSHSYGHKNHSRGYRIGNR